MSSYDEPKVQHKNTVQQIIDARQRALTAVSEVRQVQIDTPHPNLAPASGDSKKLPVVATQAVVDYLLQLRPYRSMSENWGIDFGTIELPKRIGSGSDVFGESNGADLWLCRDPHVPVRNVSQLIQSLNSDVHYSTNHPPSNADTGGVTPRGSTQPTTGCASYHIRPDGSNRTYRIDEKTFRQVQRGGLTPMEAIDMGLTKVEENTAQEENEQYTPAIPAVDDHPGDTPGSDGKLKSFKLVMGPDRLLTLVELADEIAAEVDMLAEIDLPDHAAGGGEAV
jgi:hypothetical protein